MRKLVVVVALSTSALTGAQDVSPVAGAIGGTTPILDVRVRHEAVDQAPLPEDAYADTVRLRIGAETGKAWNTTLIAEGEFVWPLEGDYRSDNAVMRRSRYPVIPDPESHEVNRLHLVNASIRDTVMTLGRQRILLDDQRFVGNVGWRQNEQTFDALRVVNRSWPSLTLDATYLNQVNRVFGPDSPQGRYRGHGYLANVAYESAIGKLTFFGYALDFEPVDTVPAALDPARASTRTYGVRLAGERAVGAVGFGYALSHALQEDHGSNPFQFDLDYTLLEVSGTWHEFNLSLGWESLEGDGQVGFVAPLGTLHRFQGWADKFLATPANGIDDRYASLGVLLKEVIGLNAVSAMGVYHEFDSERGTIELGSEVDLQLQARWRKFVGTIKYARYETQANSTPAAYQDTRKFWVMLEHAL